MKIPIPRSLSGVLLTWCLALMPTGAVWGQEAWTTGFGSGAIQQLDLATGGTTDLVGFGFSVAPLAQHPDGRLFSVRPEILEEGSGEGTVIGWVLYAVDLESLTFEEIGLLSGVDGVFDMTFDATDGLWLVRDDGRLITVDPTTAATQLIGGTNLRAVSERNGQLWGLQTGSTDQIGGFEWFLVTIDLIDGSTTSVGPVDEFSSHFAAYMDFGPEGHLWVITLGFVGIPIPPPARLFRLSTESPEDVELIRDYGNDSRVGLAISKRREVVAIPTLGPWGVGLMTLFLVGVAAGTSWRRRNA